MIKTLLLCGLLLISICYTACTHGPVSEPSLVVLELPLDLDALPAEAEFSGMAWHGDDLILLPQFPSNHGGQLYVITRAAIEATVHALESGAERVAALVPRGIGFEDAGWSAAQTGFDGFESIAIQGDHCVLTIEHEGAQGWAGRMLCGQLDVDGRGLVLDASTAVDLPSPSGRPNFSDEAIVIVDDEYWVLHELNGRRVNTQPVVRCFDGRLGTASTLLLPAIEYRITDATAWDPLEGFWVINQFWPGEAQVVDPEVPAEQAMEPVEQLLRLNLHGDRNLRVEETRPIELSPDRVVRNWEGLVKFGEDSFLAVTDRHPRTILAVLRPSTAPVSDPSKSE